MTGKLITIEGIDGSGKGTQAQQLIVALQTAGINAKMYSFPAYDQTFFGQEIGAFLRGEFGTIDQVHPKLAAMLFACDRLEQKAQLLNDLSNGIYVVCDRYVQSNIAHQGAKLPTSARSGFIDWVQQLEYQVNGLPQPDLTFFLDVPLLISKALVLKKKQRSYIAEKEDIQEAAHDYLGEVYRVYKQMEAAGHWQSINCIRGDEIKSIEAISDEIMAVLKRKVVSAP
jgi:dTMP kinase